jgi:mono/diheme cytochrome c family protein
MSASRNKVLLPGALLLLALLTGCDDMVDQPKQLAYSPQVGPGAVPSDVIEFDSKEPAAPPLTLALLERGQERYRIYCAPCHSAVGDGQGGVVQRGFPAPASFHSDRLRRAPPGYFVDVMSKGYGVMYSFAERVQPVDRWAIAAYIKALQRSQDASLADLNDTGAKSP